jgi:hypothetical protein
VADRPQQQQVHIDLHVDDVEAADRLPVELGEREPSGRNESSDNPDGDAIFAVYAIPAGHSASGPLNRPRPRIGVSSERW